MLKEKNKKKTWERVDTKSLISGARVFLKGKDSSYLGKLGQREARDALGTLLQETYNYLEREKNSTVSKEKEQEINETKAKLKEEEEKNKRLVQENDELVVKKVNLESKVKDAEARDGARLDATSKLESLNSLSKGIGVLADDKAEKKDVTAAYEKVKGMMGEEAVWMGKLLEEGSKVPGEWNDTLDELREARKENTKGKSTRSELMDLEMGICVAVGTTRNDKKEKGAMEAQLTTDAYEGRNKWSKIGKFVTVMLWAWKEKDEKVMNEVMEGLSRSTLNIEDVETKLREKLMKEMEKSGRGSENEDVTKKSLREALNSGLYDAFPSERWGGEEYTMTGGLRAEKIFDEGSGVEKHKVAMKLYGRISNEKGAPEMEIDGDGLRTMLNTTYISKILDGKKTIMRWGGHQDKSNRVLRVAKGVDKVKLVGLANIKMEVAIRLNDGVGEERDEILRKKIAKEGWKVLHLEVHIKKMGEVSNRSDMDGDSYLGENEEGVLDILNPKDGKGEEMKGEKDGRVRTGDLKGGGWMEVANARNKSKEDVEKLSELALSALPIEVLRVNLGKMSKIQMGQLEKWDAEKYNELLSDAVAGVQEALGGDKEELRKWVGSLPDWLLGMLKGRSGEDLLEVLKADRIKILGNGGTLKVSDEFVKSVMEHMGAEEGSGKILEKCIGNMNVRGICDLIVGIKAKEEMNGAGITTGTGKECEGKNQTLLEAIRGAGGVAPNKLDRVGPDQVIDRTKEKYSLRAAYKEKKRERSGTSIQEGIDGWYGEGSGMAEDMEGKGKEIIRKLEEMVKNSKVGWEGEQALERGDEQKSNSLLIFLDKQNANVIGDILHKNIEVMSGTLVGWMVRRPEVREKMKIDKKIMETLKEKVKDEGNERYIRRILETCGMEGNLWLVEEGIIALGSVASGLLDEGALGILSTRTLAGLADRCMKGDEGAKKSMRKIIAAKISLEVGGNGKVESYGVKKEAREKLAKKHLSGRENLNEGEDVEVILTLESGNRKEEVVLDTVNLKRGELGMALREGESGGKDEPLRIELEKLKYVVRAVGEESYRNSGGGVGLIVDKDDDGGKEKGRKKMKGVLERYGFSGIDKLEYENFGRLRGEKQTRGGMVAFEGGAVNWKGCFVSKGKGARIEWCWDTEEKERERDERKGGVKVKVPLEELAASLIIDGKCKGMDYTAKGMGKGNGMEKGIMTISLGYRAREEEGKLKGCMDAVGSVLKTAEKECEGLKEKREKIKEGGKVPSLKDWAEGSGAQVGNLDLGNGVRVDLKKVIKNQKDLDECLIAKLRGKVGVRQMWEMDNYISIVDAVMRMRERLLGTRGRRTRTTAWVRGSKDELFLVDEAKESRGKRELKEEYDERNENGEIVDLLVVNDSIGKKQANVRLGFERKRDGEDPTSYRQDLRDQTIEKLDELLGEGVLGEGKGLGRCWLIGNKRLKLHDRGWFDGSKTGATPGRTSGCKGGIDGLWVDGGGESTTENWIAGVDTIYKCYERSEERGEIGKKAFMKRWSWLWREVSVIELEYLIKRLDGLIEGKGDGEGLRKAENGEKERRLELEVNKLEKLSPYWHPAVVNALKDKGMMREKKHKGDGSEWEWTKKVGINELAKVERDLEGSVKSIDCMEGLQEMIDANILEKKEVVKEVEPKKGNGNGTEDMKNGMNEEMRIKKEIKDCFDAYYEILVWLEGAKIRSLESRDEGYGNVTKRIAAAKMGSGAEYAGLWTGRDELDLEGVACGAVRDTKGIGATWDQMDRCAWRILKEMGDTGFVGGKYWNYVKAVLYGDQVHGDKLAMRLLYGGIRKGGADWRGSEDKVEMRLVELLKFVLKSRLEKKDAAEGK
jgi:hypothetical protein